MDIRLLNQLAELAREFRALNLVPVICGGMAIHLLFEKRAIDSGSILRATRDVDMIVTRSQASSGEALRLLADRLTGPMEYMVVEDRKCFGFAKKSGESLDILAMPLEQYETKGTRVKLVKERLHGRLTEEASFIEEGLRTVELAQFAPQDLTLTGLTVNVPSPTNLLLMKLIAFDDRDAGPRKDDAHANADASDIYIVAMLGDVGDYRGGRELLTRHSDSPIVQRACRTVADKFSSIDGPGWLRVLAAGDLFGGADVAERRRRVEPVMRRLVRWFGVVK